MLDLELMDFSKPESDLELINFKDVFKPEFKTIDFSEPEPELEYVSKPKINENDISLRICPEIPVILIKEIGFQTTDKVGISLFPNFADSSAKLGRVQVAKYNLKMKTIICVYLALITLYFSGIGENEFKRIIEKRWDEERNKLSTPSQT